MVRHVRSWGAQCIQGSSGGRSAHWPPPPPSEPVPPSRPSRGPFSASATAVRASSQPMTSVDPVGLRLFYLLGLNNPKHLPNRPTGSWHSNTWHEGKHGHDGLPID